MLCESTILPAATQSILTRRTKKQVEETTRHSLHAIAGRASHAAECVDSHGRTGYQTLARHCATAPMSKLLSTPLATDHWSAALTGGWSWATAASTKWLNKPGRPCAYQRKRRWCHRAHKEEVDKPFQQEAVATFPQQDDATARGGYAVLIQTSVPAAMCGSES